MYALQRFYKSSSKLSYTHLSKLTVFRADLVACWVVPCSLLSRPCSVVIVAGRAVRAVRAERKHNVEEVQNNNKDVIQYYGPCAGEVVSWPEVPGGEKLQWRGLRRWGCSSCPTLATCREANLTAPSPAPSLLPQDDQTLSPCSCWQTLSYYDTLTTSTLSPPHTVGSKIWRLINGKISYLIWRSNFVRNYRPGL